MAEIYVEDHFLKGLASDYEWIESYPDYFGLGRCFTYNPKHDSSAGIWYSMGLGLALAFDDKTSLYHEPNGITLFLHKEGIYISEAT